MGYSSFEFITIYTAHQCYKTPAALYNSQLMIDFANFTLIEPYMYILDGHLHAVKKSCLSLQLHKWIPDYLLAYSLVQSNPDWPSLRVVLHVVQLISIFYKNSWANLGLLHNLHDFTSLERKHFLTLILDTGVFYTSTTLRWPGGIKKSEKLDRTQ